MSIPLISAGAVAPIVGWMAGNGCDVSRRLAEHGLGWFPEDALERPIPFLPALDFFRDAVRQHGPDLPSRIAAETGIFAIGVLGQAALQATTLGDALARIAASMHRQCSHEIIRVHNVPGGCEVTDLWALPMPDEDTAHAIQQYVAAIILSLVRLTAQKDRAPVRIRLRPHPVAGLSHLADCFGPDVDISADGTLSVFVPRALADCPLPAEIRRRLDPPDLAAWPSLRGDGSLTHAVRLLVRSMLGLETPTLDQVAAYGAMSRRSLQRQLAAEGTTFAAILGAERRARAERYMHLGEGTLRDLSIDLGYAQPGSLSRAYRRWTGASPSGSGQK
jgi:AraC-like DNA-binding protein